MAAKKPLVLTAGQIEQLQTGDTLDAVVSERELFTATNKNAGTINICMVVYQKGTADQIDLAKADAAGTSRAVGLVADTTIAADATGNFQASGLFTATTGQWDAVAGTSGGLTAGTVYYLSGATAGHITASAPGTGYVQEIGIAKSTTAMFLYPQQTIKL